jgi:hypothetical protein
MMTHLRRSNAALLIVLFLPMALCNVSQAVSGLFATPTPTLTSTPTFTPTPTVTPTPTPVYSMSVTDWEAKFLSKWDEEHEKYESNSKTANSARMYSLAYALDGNLAMYQATGNTKYLDRAIEYAINVIDNAVPVKNLEGNEWGDSYLGWGLYEDRLGPEGKESPLIESYFFRYVCRMLRIIRQTPALYDDPQYRKVYETILKFTEKNVFEKWYTRGPRYLLGGTTNMVSHWAYIAMELSLITSSSKNRKLYKEITYKVNANLKPYQNSSLRKQIIANPVDESAYFWDSVFGKKKQPGQDTSHANNVVSYLVEAHELGIYWNDADMQGLINLLLKVLWNGSYDTPTFAGYLDGSDPGGGYFQSDGFMKLGRYDPYVQKLYENFNGHISSYTQYYGNAALNAKMLSEP